MMEDETPTEELAPTTGFKLGRREYPNEIRAKVRLADFLDASKLPTPPAEFDYTPAASKSLHNVMKNNQLGCCTISAFWHIRGIATANAGAEINATDAQIVHDYSKACGYVPGKPSTDQGGNEQDVLDYFTRTGAADGLKINGWLKVGTGNLDLAVAINWLFEGLYLGSGIPNAWLNVQGDGFTWDAGRGNPNNGHAFPLFAHGQGRFKVSTWGMVGNLTDRAFQGNISEAYVLLDEEIVNKVNQKAPNAIDWRGLVEYWNSLGGQILNPPPPLPTPWMDIR